MVDIFISYASEDRDRVKSLVNALEEQGWSTFWDWKSIPVGMAWRELIKKCLDETKCVLVLWSQKSINSEWVIEEAEYAKSNNKILFPVRLDDVRPPLGFGQIQAANLVNWKGDKNNQEIKKLVASVKSVIGLSADKMKLVASVKSVIGLSADKMSIKLLHLSDLHFTENTSPMEKFLFLVNDICKSDCFENGSIDYIVISGDITDRGKVEGFKNAYEFVSLLNRKFKVSAERCIFVPGNHDIKYLKAAYKMYNSENKAYNAETYENKCNGPQRFKKFSTEFFQKIVQKPYPLDYSQQGIAYFFPETKIQFLTLNSAWEISQFNRKRSGFNPDAVANVIAEGKKQIRDAVRRGEIREGEKILRICVWHHSMLRHERMRYIGVLEDLQKEDIKICLHGDVQQMNRDLFKYTHNNKIHIIGAGSLGTHAESRSESIPKFYNFIEIKRNLVSVRVHTRYQGDPDWLFDPIYLWPRQDGSVGALSYYDIDLI